MSKRIHKNSNIFHKSFSKKGSLNLFIVAIVVVVIAFVVLGLGLRFLGGQIQNPIQISSTIREQIRQQVLDDLRTGDKRLTFPVQEISIGKKEFTVEVIGIKNVKQGQLKYRVEITDAGGEPIFGDDITDNFFYEKGTEDLKPTETRLLPVRIESENLAGTGQFKITIKDITDGTTYDTKTFFIKVVG